MSTSSPKTIKIIGGGLSGLFVAYHLVKKAKTDSLDEASGGRNNPGYRIEIFEKANRLGGLIQTLHLDWGVVETAANGVINSQRLEALAEDIGLEWVPAQKKYKKRYIYRGKPKQFPLGFLESWQLIKNLFKNTKPDARETLRAFGDRVFGPATTNYILEPAVLGVFGAEAKDLSATLVYKYFFGGGRVPPKQKSRRGTVAPAQGMAGLVEALGRWLQREGVKIHLSSAISADDLQADGRGAAGDHIYVIATDAHTAASLVEKIDNNASDVLKSIEYRPLSTVTLSYDEPARLKGFGCLFPRDQGFNSYGVLFNTCIFAGRGPNETETWILPDGESSPDALLRAVMTDSERLYKKRLTVKNSMITVWPKALPLYSIRLEDDLKLLSLPRGVYLTGNYLGQIGLGRIFDGSFYLAEQINCEIKLEAQ